MKRQKRRNKRPKKQNRAAPVPAVPTAEAPSEDEAPSRRAFLGKMRNGAIAALVVGGGGWFAVGKVRAMMREQDLTRIGNGIPTVVQIHDPQCSQCLALQRETREALCEFSDDDLQYVVANIRSAEGRALAATHRVGHVTLLLFDGNGERRMVLSGPNRAENLADAFRRHVARSKKS